MDGMTRAESPTSAYQQLLDELPVGVVFLDDRGGVVRSNAQAASLLSTPDAPRVEAALRRLQEAAAQSLQCMETSLEVHSGRLLVKVGPDERPGLWMGLLDKQPVEKAREEASLLRTVLQAVASMETREVAMQTVLEAVKASLSLNRLVYFEPEAAGAELKVVPGSDLGLVELALKHGRIIHVPDTGVPPAPLPFDELPGRAAVLIPLANAKPPGVLYGVAAPSAMNEGALRVLQSLDDALTALLTLSCLEADAARARDVAARHERLATIGQLVAGVAHEINNPLAFLKSNLNSLKLEVDSLKASSPSGLSELSEVDAIVSESLEGVSRIETLVQALKGTSRQRTEQVPFDPSRAVGDAVMIFKGAKKGECDVEHHLESLPEVLGAPAALGQVALNLMQNGLDAMSGKPRAQRKLTVRGWAKDGEVVLSFRDEGTGIPPSVQARMFDAFYTTKEAGKGTGLGLYICKQIVEAMSGRLTLTTGPDGTCFEVHLPAGKEDIAPLGAATLQR